MNATSRALRSKIGVAERLRPHDTEAINALRQAFAASRLEEAILATLAERPLTKEQCQKLADLLTARSAR